jgi:hypothetical protein
MSDWPLVVAGVAFLVCATLHFANRREKTTPEQLDDPLVRAATCIESLYEGTIGAVGMFVAITAVEFSDTAIKALALPTWAENPAQGFASTAIWMLGPMFLAMKPRKASDIAAFAAVVAFFGIFGAISFTMADGLASAFHHLQSMS